MPDLLHFIPVRHDAMLDGVFERKDASLCLSFVADIGILHGSAQIENASAKLDLAQACVEAQRGRHHDAGRAAATGGRKVKKAHTFWPMPTMTP